MSFTLAYLSGVLRPIERALCRCIAESFVCSLCPETKRLQVQWRTGENEQFVHRENLRAKCLLKLFAYAKASGTPDARKACVETKLPAHLRAVRSPPQEKPER
ncbi:MAG: hypothetical protein WBO09_17295 [Methylocystis silviterrae]|uniref:hypothetical protein n=1 Tax=Methylocystis silviterrae TaxID=2743612 RepID=UPI003C762014